MNAVDTMRRRAEIRALITAQFIGQLHALGLQPDSLHDDVDLMAEGIVDSLGFLELLAAVEQCYGTPIDFDGLPADQLTMLGPLCDHLAAQIASRGETGP